MRVLRTMTTIACLLLTLALVTAGTAGGVGGRPFTTQLEGANEVPVTGDADATGTAHLWINPGQGSVCWSITVSNVEPILAAHIHAAPAGVPGPIVVPLNPYTGGCTTVDRDLAIAILTNPSDYYVNVHNADFPGGAARGQLSHHP
jgi:CHRD domain-containing protein